MVSEVSVLNFLLVLQGIITCSIQYENDKIPKKNLTL
jgi:hypothetical protein